MSLKVLFVGNTFTARNNVPGMIESLASAHGREFEPRLISVGGASLRTHWNKGEAQKYIRDGNFNYVVLQEQSTLPVKNAARMHENVRLFDELIKSSGAQTVLYLTWARQHAPQSQKTITDAYTSIGHELGAMVVPVGVVWERFLSEHKSPVLHDKDKSHPTLAGSYLAACTFFAMLFGAGAADMKWRPEAISDAHAKLIQDAAAVCR
jgi:hypothetical protein